MKNNTIITIFLSIFLFIFSSFYSADKINKNQQYIIIDNIENLNNIIKKEKKAEHYYNLGKTYTLLAKNNWKNEKEHYRKAIENFKNVITIEQKAEYFDNLGKTYTLLAKCDKEKQREYWLNAITNLTIAIELDSVNMKYFNTRGEIFFNLKDYEKAITDHTQSINLNEQKYQNLTSWDHNSFTNKMIPPITLAIVAKLIMN